jgi:hypothetical protein
VPLLVRVICDPSKRADFARVYKPPCVPHTGKAQGRRARRHLQGAGCVGTEGRLRLAVRGWTGAPPIAAAAPVFGKKTSEMPQC